MPLIEYPKSFKERYVEWYHRNQKWISWLGWICSATYILGRIFFKN